MYYLGCPIFPLKTVRQKQKEATTEQSISEEAPMVDLPQDFRVVTTNMFKELHETRLQE